jgi:hypothetical protein
MQVYGILDAVFRWIEPFPERVKSIKKKLVSYAKIC